MKMILKAVSYTGLALTLLPSFFVFAGEIEFKDHIVMMLIGTILWFVSAPFWMNKKQNIDEVGG